MRSNAYNIDCLDYMRGLPDKYFSLAIADPPYGIKDAGGQTGGSGKLKGRVFNNGYIDRWDKAPSQDFFDELLRVSKNQIIWGGNYFNLPPTRCFICWDKVQPWPNFSQCEFAWTDYDKPAKHVTISNRGGHIDSVNWHPTAKPVELYTYLLRTFGEPGISVFDPMIGSGSSRIAAYKMGVDFTGCEIDRHYFEKSEERFQSECLGITHLPNGMTETQTKLFEP